MNAQDSKEQRPLFGPEDLIHVYTRADAIEDGTLVDVSETAREAGIRVPVALTRAVWADVDDVPPSKKGIQDAPGRLWDLLWMARHAAANVTHPEEKDNIFFRLVMHVGRSRNYRAKMVCAPGDDGEPALTILRPHEDWKFARRSGAALLVGRSASPPGATSTAPPSKASSGKTCRAGSRAGAALPEGVKGRPRPVQFPEREGRACATSS
ncbi:MAG: hypothetical protein M3R38_08365 [Actinomycetota bacterium]|nr:hypothetical protein [Actinomycetota bacterium]